jgi:hypothetical protein
LRATRVANLAPSGGNPCLGADFRPVAVADGALFYLDSNSTESVLYRVAAS